MALTSSCRCALLLVWKAATRLLNEHEHTKWRNKQNLVMVFATLCQVPGSAICHLPLFHLGAEIKRVSRKVCPRSIAPQSTITSHITHHTHQSLLYYLTPHHRRKRTKNSHAIEVGVGVKGTADSGPYDRIKDRSAVHSEAKFSVAMLR